MLTDEQRQIIEAEEQLRHEVRRRLDTENPPPPPPPAPQHGFGKRVFDFFNSSVGMWLLSSVVLTGGAALLQNIQHNHEVAQTLWIPFRTLAAGEGKGTFEWTWEGKTLELPCIRIGPEKHVLWGMTYRMLETMLEALSTSK